LFPGRKQVKTSFRGRKKQRKKKKKEKKGKHTRTLVRLTPGKGRGFRKGTHKCAASVLISEKGKKDEMSTKNRKLGKRDIGGSETPRREGEPTARLGRPQKENRERSASNRKRGAKNDLGPGKTSQKRKEEGCSKNRFPILA